MKKNVKVKEPGERQKKADYALSEERTNEIIKLKMLGISYQEIVQHCALNWRICRRQIDVYLAKATKYFKQCAVLDREAEIGKGMARYQDLYAKSMMIQDYRECRAVQKAINELWGLEAPKKEEHTGKDGKPIELTIDVFTKIAGMDDDELDDFIERTAPPGSSRKAPAGAQEEPGPVYPETHKAE